MDIQTIYPPLIIVYIGNGYEAYSNQIKIPEWSKLTSQYDDSERQAYFIAFNAAYQNKTLTDEEIWLLHDKLQDFPPMVLFYVKQRTKKLNPNYL